MKIEIKFLWNEISEQHPDLPEQIRDILRSSYDYQNNHMDFIDEDEGAEIRSKTFILYPALCDQSKRTEETLRQIIDLIVRNL